MSQEKINQRLIKSNIDQLSKIVKRPAVTEKILSRPPFRFIFDLTTMIIKTTGYLRGLYSEEEFNFDNVNVNKETKMAFLDKLIDVIGFINGKPIDCKSAKIVAGVEVEKTNKLLNEFAKCVLDKKPFLESVEKVRKGPKNKIDKVDNNKEKTTKAVMADKQSDGEIKSKNTKTKSTKQTTKATVADKVKQTNQQEIKKSTSVKSSESSKNEIDKSNIKEEDNIDEMNTRLDIDTINYNSTRRPSTTTKTEIQNRDEKKVQEKDDHSVIETTPAVQDDLDDALEQQLSSLDNGNQLIKNEKQIMDEDLPIIINDNQMNKNGSEKNSNKTFESIENNRSKQSIVNDNNIQIDDNNDDDLIASLKQIEPPVDNDFHLKSNESLSNKAINNNNNDDDDDDKNKQIQSNRPKNHREKSSTILRKDLKNDVNETMMIKSMVDNNNSSARPKSSRPAPPRVMTASRSRLSQLMENRTEQFGTETTTTINSNIWIPETVDDEMDEFLISSQKLQDSFLTSDSNNLDQITDNNNNDVNQTEESKSKGHLVQQLMATKTELEGQIKDSNHLDSNNSNKQPMINDTNQLKNQIQSLCQSIGTLTKAMNYLHEDVEPMLDELTKWKTEYETNNKIIMKIRSEMNNDLEPLRKELEQIERQCDDFDEQIRITKSNVFRNEQIITKLINSV
ncbi:TRAF3-interacting protein 1 [Dermatophagoides pteronyssinus]|uniref:TRAF3-interacting protein 1 n=1 Tax=Dermatophagoides pteronyssinus TaxID=6956 RepID=A0ABQ8JDB2_DERPT|nr:TRAF3-interacting protein 1 [Dermatophagoides pteronyssinus]